MAKDKWPDDRIEDFMTLKMLLNECEKIDRANYVIERLQKIIELATTLNTSDRDLIRPSFIQFLQSKAFGK